MNKVIRLILALLIVFLGLPLDVRIEQGRMNLGLKEAQAAWLSGYTYRKQLTITGSTGAGTGYQVKLTIDSTSGSANFDLEGHCANFPNDITFTDDDGSTELYYWIEDATADPITVWVKVTDSLESNANIYCYYGKSSDNTNDSDGTNTFEFFDGFDSYTDGDLNGQPVSNPWSGNTRFDIQGTIYRGASGKAVTQGNSYPNTDTISHAISDLTIGSAVMYMRVLDTGNTISNWQLKEGATVKLGVQATGGSFYYLNNAGSYVALPTPTTYAANTWYKVEIIFDASTDNYLSIKIDDVEKAATQPSSQAFTKIDSVEIQSYGYSSSQYSYYDDIRVRKYASTEPSFSSASGESTSETTLRDATIRDAVIR